jgi:hypothetical protein
LHVLLDPNGAKAAIAAWKDGVAEAVWSDTVVLMRAAEDTPVLEALDRLGFM